MIKLILVFLMIALAIAAGIHVLSTATLKEFKLAFKLTLLGAASLVVMMIIAFFF